MTITTLSTNVASIGVGATLSLTVPAGGIPASSFICIPTAWNQAIAYTSALTIADDAGNTYRPTKTLFSGSPAGGLQTFYVYNSLALSAGQHITITSASGPARVYRINGFFSNNDVYSAGDPYDAAASNTGSGSSTTLTVPAGSTPAHASLIVGSVYRGNTSAFTQDARYTFPPDQVTAFGSASMEGGHASSSTAISYAPTVATSAAYIGNLIAFRLAALPSLTGDLSQTFGALTLSAQGGVGIEGDLNDALAAATLSAAGQVLDTGGLAATLGALTLTASGLVIPLPARPVVRARHIVLPRRIF